MKIKKHFISKINGLKFYYFTTPDQRYIFNYEDKFSVMTMGDQDLTTILSQFYNDAVVLEFHKSYKQNKYGKTWKGYFECRNDVAKRIGEKIEKDLENHKVW